MKYSLKTQAELACIREGGARLAYIVSEVCKKVVPGVSTDELDQFAKSLIEKVGGTPSFLGYRPFGVKTAYPAALCVSVNEEVIHGIPKPHVIIKEGDIVSVDCGLKYKGYFTDHAVTVVVGDSGKVNEQLVRVCQEAMMVGIAECRAGKSNLDPGRAIEKFIAGRYGIVEDLAGHGVGYAVHEDPYIPNYAMKGAGVKMHPGLVIAVEPMLTIGSKHVLGLSDEYTVVTQSGNKAAHFEHTVIITDGEPEIVTLTGNFEL